MEAKFTKGPWRWEVNLKHKGVALCGGVPRFDSDVLRFERYGMQGAQPTFADNELGVQGLKSSDLSVVVEGREHHEDWFRGLNHPDAHLIAAAPEMYEALEMIKNEWNLECSDMDFIELLLAKARGEHE